eukprot:575909-Rhodomonas_salina.2
MAKKKKTVHTLLFRREHGKPLGEDDMNWLCHGMYDRARASKEPPHPQEQKKFDTLLQVCENLSWLPHCVAASLQWEAEHMRDYWD